MQMRPLTVLLRKTFVILAVYLSLFSFIFSIASAEQFSVLIDNKRTVTNNNIHNVTFISVPFSGHSNILMKYALNLACARKFKISFIVTGWENITIASQNLKELAQAGIKVDVINDKPLASPAPMTFAFPRTVNLVDKTIELAKESDLIIYDFFALEGYFAGRKLNVPALCSIPAIIGPFNPENSDFQKGIRDNMVFIRQLEEKFDIQFLDKIEMVSDAFLLPSEQENIIWTWPAFIEASDYKPNRKLNNPVFVRSKEKESKGTFSIGCMPDQKLIYVSLGTVVTKNLWNNVPAVKTFVSKIFQELVRTLGNKEKYIVIISTGREPHEVIDNIPANFHVFESVPQEAVLKKASLFITHGGGNSVNEAIDNEVPMLVIPFFGDQHLCALNVANTGIGISFLHPVEDREKAINTESGLFERKSLDPISNLSDAIMNVLEDRSFNANLAKIKQKKPELESNIIANKFLFLWREGDLLFGINNDRRAFANVLGLEDYFKIGNIQPFSQHISGQCSLNSLPRLVDQYNDVLRSSEYAKEIRIQWLPKYAQFLQGYNSFLLSNSLYLEPIGHYPNAIPQGESPQLETLWNMCLGGMHYFLSRGSMIHFVIKDYDAHINKATTKEIDWLRSNWDQPGVKNNVKFYLIRQGMLEVVDPVQYNWFQ